MTVDAFWLPGLDPGDVAAWETRDLGPVRLRWPALLPAALRGILAAVAEARRGALARAGVAGILHAIDGAAARLADPADPLRATAEAALPSVTGYSPAMVRLVLDRMVADWRAPALERLLRAELGDPGVLDGFVPDPMGARRSVHARGPELVFHLFSGNVPGVAVTSLVRSLLVKSASLGKTAADEPVLAPLFARALADAAPALAGALAVTYWPGGTRGLEEVALDAADAVVAYGGADALTTLSGLVRPGTRLLDHGPRYSFGVVAREALRGRGVESTAAAVARAAATFDQQGCVSPHLVYVERGGEVEPREFARLIAGALGAVELELPRGRISAAEAAAVHQARAELEFRAIAGDPVDVHAGPGTAYTVAYEDGAAFLPSGLSRFLRVTPVDDILDVVAPVRGFAAFLQTVAVAGAGDRLEPLARDLAATGACRITTFDDAPWPPPEWHHDGRGPLRELLRWSDLER
jgi:hypothetical protein